MSELLAVYGTLKNGYGNNVLLKNSEFVGEGQTVNKYSMKNFGVPMVYYSPEVAPVKIELYKVDEKTLTGPLDRLEGHPTFYCRSKIPVKVNDKIYDDVWMYFSPDKAYEPKTDSSVEPKDGLLIWSRA